MSIGYKPIYHIGSSIISEKGVAWELWLFCVRSFVDALISERYNGKWLYKHVQSGKENAYV
ncbi:hypothetical protein PATA110616_09660 [Paenibacillus tarimensis]